MTFGSTRGKINGLSFSEAVLTGISPDGGLFVPEGDIVFDSLDMTAMADMNYCDLAVNILKRYATDYTQEELRLCAHKAYGSGDPAPLKHINKTLNVLELWHGPTCAFKDMALQILPEFMRISAQKVAKKNKTLILTATSGDTGKAALEGFRDCEDVKIMVFYPRDGVSDMQKYQMITQEGSNVSVVAVDGNFDDAQTGVKNIFTDKAFTALLAERGYELSSANSINIGRLVPQIVYYFYAYFTLVRNKEIKLGTKINFAVPTGNFGNILAAYYAMKSGLPVNKIICATNINNVVSDFINTGTYDSNREFQLTISPAMDILVSSNLERLIYDVTDGSDDTVADLMKSLKENGFFSIGRKPQNIISRNFWSSCSTEKETSETIRNMYNEYHYLIDPHTAVGINVYDKYVISTSDMTKTVAVSTASPFKFNKSVAEAITASQNTDALNNLNEFQLLDFLSEQAGLPIPQPLLGLDKKAILHTKCCDRGNMKDEVLSFIE